MKNEAAACSTEETKGRGGFWIERHPKDNKHFFPTRKKNEMRLLN